jgi:transglutaminase-like putative cysteine protease
VKLVERFRVFVLFLVLLAMIAFCVSQRSVELLLVVAPLAILSWYVTEGPRGIVLPRVAQNILLLVLLAWAGLSWSRLPDLADTMGLLGRFVLWLLLVKLYGKKTSRDYAQIIALSAVLVMAGTLQSVEFAFSIFVFLYTALVLWTVLLYQLWSTRERARESRDSAIAAARTAFGAGPAAALAPPVQAVVGRSVAWHFRALGLTSIGLGIAISLGVFVIFPRELADRARGEFGLGPRRVGFSEDVQLFTNGRINDNQREVFRVTWNDSRDESIRFSEPLYLRGAVLDRYRPEEARWARSGRSVQRPISTEAAPNEPPGTFQALAPDPIDERFQTYVQRTTMSSLASDVVFAAWAPIAIASLEGRRFEFDTSTLLLREVRVGGIGRSRTYTVKVQPFANEAALAALGAGTPPVREPTFPVPEVREFTLGLLDELRAFDPPTAEEIAAQPEKRWLRNRGIARVLNEWLQSNRFTYTTDIGAFSPIEGEDPIVSFLTRYRFGHCEYFASALVAMCQSVGIESRLVTGYLAIEFDETTREYIVRESNAHAWAEVRVGPFGWQRFDPTPSETLEALQERRRSWADGVRWFYDRLEFLWNSQVVTFDSTTQASLADRVGGVWQRSFSEWLDRLRMQARALNESLAFGGAGAVWLGLIAVAFGFAFASAAIVRRRRRRLRAALGLVRSGSAERRLVRTLGFWLDVLDVLDRRGAAKPAARTPRMHGEALADAPPEARTAYAELVELYYAVRFAGKPLDAAAKARAASLVAALDRGLALRPERRR